MIAHDFKLTGNFSLPLTKAQFLELDALKKLSNPNGSPRAIGAKTISRIIGYDRGGFDYGEEELFRWDTMTHRSLDPKRPLHEQSVDLAAVVILATACSCMMHTCTLSHSSGCPLYRNTEAMKIVADAVSLKTVKATSAAQDDTYSLELDFDAFKKAYVLFFKDNPVPITGPMCHGSEQCAMACTYESGRFFTDKGLAGLENPEGVLISHFEQLMASLSQVTRFHEEFMHPPAVELPETLAVVGSGPAGISAAIRARSKGYKVTLIGTEPKLLGTIYVSVPIDKWNPDNMIGITQEVIEGMGIEYIPNTYVGNVPEEKRKPGVNYLSFDALHSQADAVIDATGKFDTPRKPGFTGEDTTNVVYAGEFLRQVNEYLFVFRDALDAARIEKEDLNVVEFMQRYAEKTPFRFKIKDQSYKLEELEYELVGFGQTRDDVLRMLILLNSAGDPKRFNLKINNPARSVTETHTDSGWPSEYEVEQSTNRIMALADPQGQQITIGQYLMAIKAIHIDGSENITTVEYKMRQIKNPKEAHLNRRLAQYTDWEAGDVRQISGTSGKKLVVIVAAGYSQKANLMHQEAGLVDNKGDFSGHTNYATDLPSVFVAGDRANGSDKSKNILPAGAQPEDVVVFAAQTGILAAEKAHIFIQRRNNTMYHESMSKPEAARVVWDEIKNTTITPAQVFTGQLATPPSQLIKLALSRESHHRLTAGH